MKIETHKIIVYIFSSILKTIVLITLLSLTIFQLSAATITPIKIISKVNSEVKVDQITSIKKNLIYLVPSISNQYLNDLSRSIKLASDATNINDNLIISVAYYESKFNKNALSSAGYRGIMQATTHDIYEFAEVDIIRGAKKMQHWINYRQGNLRYALASYNGGVYPPESSYDYADMVIKLSNKLAKVN